MQILKFIILQVFCLFFYAASGQVSLDNYELSSGPIVLDEDLGDLSGTAYHPATNTLYGVTNKEAKLVHFDTQGNLIREITLNDFDDVEGIAYLGGNDFIITQERLGNLVILTIPPNNDGATEEIDFPAQGVIQNTTTYSNEGFEGISYDIPNDVLYIVKEKSPMAIYKIEDPYSKIDQTFTFQTAFDLNTTAETYSQDFTDVAGITYSPQGTLLLLSHEDRRVVEVDPLTGTLITGSTLDVSDQFDEPEGITIAGNGNIFIVSEPNLYARYVKINPSCTGTAEEVDSDNDGVCDVADLCPGFNDNLIGTPCEDGDDCTSGETYDTDCGCSGGSIQDADNDGICDALDTCNSNLAGTTCEDGNPCTTGETYDANCNCTGGVYTDADNDGICAGEDDCDNLNNTLLGMICDDGDPSTKFDIYTAEACGCAGIITSAEICSKISRGGDDAEESLNSGEITLTSSDLDMIGSAIVGLRFQNIDIPNGATISSASIQFGSDENDSGAATLSIKAEAADDSAPFTSAAQSISNKETTTATVTWQPAPWTSVGIQETAQKTVDLSPIIQEVINRPGFVAGNAISIIIQSSGSRVAESYNTSPSLAAELCIAYSSGDCRSGYPCDDNNSATENDVVQADCSCAGTIIPPTYDCPTLLANIGDACNDNNANTENDVIQANCACAGTIIPPTYDCPTLLANIGDTCNDNNPNTQNDVVKTNCACAGTIIPPTYDCPTLLANIGDTCNDNNTNTENDVVKTNCACAGTIIPPTYDCPTLLANIGDTCNDNNTNTENDVVKTNCACAGTIIPPTYDCPTLLANIGDACNDNNTNTENDMIQANCACAGTIIPPTYDCPILLANVGDACNDGDTNTENDVVKANCVCEGLVILTLPCPELAANFGDPCNDNNSNTENDIVQEDCSCAGTIIPPTYDCPTLLANVGDTCNDGDANTESDVVKANCTCEGFVILTLPCPELAANFGDPCNDNDSNTENDIVQEDCSCAGTTIASGSTTTETCNGNTSITYGNGSIKMEGFTDSEYFFQIFTADWQLVSNCGWQCGTSQTVTGLSQGDYRVFIKNSNYQIVCLKTITLSATTNDPDNDNDGLPLSEDCDDNDPNLTAPGAICNDGDNATENDIIQTDCTCAGTAIASGGNTTTETCNGNTSITYGNGTIKMDGLLESAYFFQVFTSSWQQVFNCGWQCGTSQTVTGLPEGNYKVFIKNNNYQIICLKDITLTAGTTGGGDPDNDSDGLPASQDCNDNDANLTTAGAACDDADASTENDVVQANCTCAGTPINTGGGSDITTNCGDVVITYGNGTVSFEGIAGTQYYFKINDLNDGWRQVAGCSYNCGAQYEKTGLADSRYLLTIYNKNWTKHCDKEIIMGASSISSEASSRTKLKQQKANFNLGLEAIEIFPNPARQELFINLPTQEVLGSIKIVNSFGQVMKEVRAEQVLEDLMRLDISNLQKGLYHLVILTENKQPVTRKIMVQ